MTPTGSLMPPAKLELLHLLIRDEATAADLASRMGLHVTVVRRHLKLLLLAGLVEARSRPATRGRPTLLYRITLSGREVFFAKYDVILERLVTTLLHQAGDHATKALFESMAKTFALEAGRPRSLKEVISLLQGIGFEPELRRRAGERQLLSHNCPILKVAREHPELTCDTFHCTLLGELLGTSPRPLRQAISRGAPYCVHELELPA